MRGPNVRSLESISLQGEQWLGPMGYQGTDLEPRRGKQGEGVVRSLGVERRSEGRHRGTMMRISFPSCYPLEQVAGLTSPDAARCAARACGS